MPFKKGKSGNPKGRKPGIIDRRHFTTAKMLIEQVMLEERTFEVELAGEKLRARMTNFQALVYSTLALAMGGDAPARSWIGDRWLGKAVQPVDFGGGTGEGIKIIIEGLHAGANGNGNGNGNGKPSGGIKLVEDEKA